MDEIPQIKPEPTLEGSILLPVDKQETVAPTTPVVKKRKFALTSKTKKILRVSGIIFAVLLVLIGLPIFNLFLKSKPLIASSRSLSESVKTQDIKLIEKELDGFNMSLTRFRSAFKLVSWMRLIPFGGKYVADAGYGLAAATDGVALAKLTLTTVEPYADFLGLQGAATSGEKTSEDRIDFIIAALPDIAKNIDQISEKLSLVNSNLAHINPNDYPESFRGKKIRENIKQGLTLVDQAQKLVVNGKPVIEHAPYLLGSDEKRNYLVLFQNDKELRPSGGFLTAYSLTEVEKGKFKPVSSNDIYNLDAKYKRRIDAPDPIIDYLKGPYTVSKDFFLRDLNWSPDFEEGMELFLGEAKTAGIGEVDGIIAVDTQLLVNILDVLGPIGVPGFGNFSTAIEPKCNCPQVIYELESFADVEGPIVWDPVSGKIVYQPPNADNRKSIIGPLTNSILANMLAQPKEKLPDLIEALTKSLFEKHVLFYVVDEEVQAALAEFGVSGRIVDFDGDYLHINDANLGGRKSNLYVTQEVVQDIEVERDGSVVKTVAITYKNPEKHDGWLNSVLPNWVRIYVPKGSELVSFDGVEDKAEPYEDLGKTVFAGFFELRPEGVTKVTVSYKLPFKVDKEYNLLIQKQPGTDKPLHTVNFGKKTEEFYLTQDKTLNFPR